LEQLIDAVNSKVWPQHNEYAYSGVEKMILQMDKQCLYF